MPQSKQKDHRGGLFCQAGSCTLGVTLAFLRRLSFAGVVGSIVLNFSITWAPVPCGITPTFQCYLPSARVVRSTGVDFSVGSAPVACEVTHTFVRWLPFARVVSPLGANFSVRSAPVHCWVTPTSKLRLPSEGRSFDRNELFCRVGSCTQRVNT